GTGPARSWRQPLPRPAWPGGRLRAEEEVTQNTDLLSPKDPRMSLKIRLARAGTKKRPYYHVVIADSRSPRDGRFIEKVGRYDPMLADDSQRVTLVTERIQHWLGVGATPTDRVLRFLDAAGL